MNRLLICFILFCFQIHAHTQVLAFVEGDTIIKLIDADEYTPAHTRIDNLIDSSAIFEWEIINFDHPSGWYFSLCDYPFCYTDGQTSGVMDVVPPLSNYAFITVNVESTYPDTGIYQIRVWNQNFPAYADTLTVIMISGPNFSNITKLSNESLPFYHHQADRNEIQIKNPCPNNLRVDLYTISGQLIETITLAPYQDHTLFLSQYNTGMYLITLSNELTFYTSSLVPVH